MMHMKWVTMPIQRTSMTTTPTFCLDSLSLSLNLADIYPPSFRPNRSLRCLCKHNLVFLYALVKISTPVQAYMDKQLLDTCDANNDAWNPLTYPRVPCIWCGVNKRFGVVFGVGHVSDSCRSRTKKQWDWIMSCYKLSWGMSLFQLQGTSGERVHNEICAAATPSQHHLKRTGSRVKYSQGTTLLSCYLVSWCS